MRHTYWKSGDYSAICDVCGHKFKASQLKLRWDGLHVCKTDWEVRHPQELIRSVPDQIKRLWTRPEATDTFIDVTYHSIGDTSAVAGVAIAGKAISGTP